MTILRGNGRWLAGEWQGCLPLFKPRAGGGARNRKAATITWKSWSLTAPVNYAGNLAKAEGRIWTLDSWRCLTERHRRPDTNFCIGFGLEAGQSIPKSMIASHRHQGNGNGNGWGRAGRGWEVDAMMDRVLRRLLPKIHDTSHHPGQGHLFSCHSGTPRTDQGA